MGDIEGTGGPGGAHSGYKIDWTEATRIADEFKAKQKAEHQARIAARAEARKAKRGDGMETGEYGPPNPWKFRKGRPPMRTG